MAGGRLQGITVFAEDPVVRASLAEVLEQRPPFDVIALHAPVGLPDRPGTLRACDTEARALLGWPRQAVVLPVPARSVLGTTSYRRAQRRNGGMSPVTFARMAHVAEVDAEMQPYQQRVVTEVQPELTLWDLNGRVPLVSPRRAEQGMAERATLLVGRIEGVDRVTRARMGGGVRPGHLVDAAASLWTARRLAARTASRLPADPEWDSRGLRMEIAF